MNERIRELIEQATVLDYSTWDSHNQKTKDHYKFDKEKFAELLIRECCEVLREEVEVALSAVGSPVYPEGLIYEHFGVEE